MLEKHWGQSDDLILLLGNFVAGGAEIDLAVVKKDSLTIIDLKNYGGAISVAENGPWFADGKEVKGGSKRNPYRQIRDNKFAVLRLLESKGIPKGPRNNLGHISGVVAFHRPTTFDRDQLPPKITTWLHVTDLEHLVQTLAAITSQGLEFSEEEIRSLPSSLGLTEYIPAGGGDVAERPSPRPVRGDVLPPVLMGAFRRIEKFLADPNQQVMIVRGMTGTGGHVLIEETQKTLRASDAEYSVLSPNRRTAKTYEGASSIYSVMYDSSPRIEKDQWLYGLQANSSAESHVYLVTDAHLISNALWEIGLFRFGTGKLLSDLIEFVTPQTTQRKLLLFGDPYQLGRGRPEESALDSNEVGRLSGTSPQELHQEKLLADDPDMLTINARRIADQLAGGIYNRLHVDMDGLTCVGLPNDQKEKADEVRRLFEEDSTKTKFLAYENEQVNQINEWIRKDVFGNIGSLQSGDLIHFHGGCIASVKNDPSANPVLIKPESFARVSTVVEEKPIRQTLRGRDEPVVVEFLRVEAILLGQDKRTMEFYCFKDYLVNVTPGMSREITIALRAFAHEQFNKENADLINKRDSTPKEGKSGQREVLDKQIREARSRFVREHPMLNAARIRFGYAMTVHRAQGRRWPRVIATMDYQQGKANSAFFRWVYTIFAIADDKLVLSNVPKIHPLMNMTWSEGRAKIGLPNIGPFVPFDPDEGVEPLRQRVTAAINDIGARLVQNSSHQYQEQFVVSGGDGERCTLSMYYGSGRGLSKIIMPHSDPIGFAKDLVSSLSEISAPDEFRKQLLETINEKLGAVGSEVIALRCSDWEEIYLVKTPEGIVELSASYKKNGFITKLEPLSYENSAAKDLVKTAMGVT